MSEKLSFFPRLSSKQPSNSFRYISLHMFHLCFSDLTPWEEAL